MDFSSKNDLIYLFFSIQLGSSELKKLLYWGYNNLQKNDYLKFNKKLIKVLFNNIL